MTKPRIQRLGNVTRRDFERGHRGRRRRHRTVQLRQRAFQPVLPLAQMREFALKHDAVKQRRGQKPGEHKFDNHGKRHGNGPLEPAAGIGTFNGFFHPHRDR